MFNGISARSDIRTINVNTNVITNWEIHDENDKDAIDRKRFCTELNNENFCLITFNDIKHYLKQLKCINYDIDHIHLCVKHSNYILHKPYQFDYQEWKP